MSTPPSEYAFPSRIDWPQRGVSLRDYIATRAMLGILSGDAKLIPATEAALAAKSYAVADAMLSLRPRP